MKRYAGRLLIAGVLCLSVVGGAAGCSPDKEGAPASPPQKEAEHSQPAERPLVQKAVPLAAADIPYRPEVFIEGLQVPWALALAPDGRMFFTERPGTLRVIREGVLLTEPVLSLPPPFVEQGEGGLLGLALDPKFAENHYLYVYHSYEQNGQIKNRVLRLVERNNRAKIDKVLLDHIPGNGNHNGGRLRFGPDGMLYITTGDALDRERSQQREDLAGKILRIRSDGTIPQDNPDPASPVYSYGHRNPQGLAWHPQTGQMYSVEHGQSAHDELNIIKAGANYGWPVIEGDERQEGMEPPLMHSGEDTWAPSGLSFISQGPWKNQLLAANLRGQQVWKADMGEEKQPTIVSLHALFPDRYGRIRDIVEGADGSLYILTNNRDGRGQERPGDDKIIRLKPQ
ncbi:PQQ-dependent sugar dehydrogenase [Aneurinibacillus sp. REN35]|uniref:PQQ-dependent sugar dehydrogenase n=1 Tax=Aneurinibacillus sp. REN35 TaxID=3237286 RepID=UPI003527C17E